MISARRDEGNPASSERHMQERSSPIPGKDRSQIQAVSEEGISQLHTTEALASATLPEPLADATEKHAQQAKRDHRLAEDVMPAAELRPQKE